MTRLQHTCDLRTMVDPFIRAGIEAAPSLDYTIEIDDLVRCPDCDQWWLVEGTAFMNGEADLRGERRWRWWRWHL